MQMKMHRNTDGYRHWRTGRPQVDQKYTYRRACHGCSMYLGLGGKLSPKSLTFGVGPFFGGWANQVLCSTLDPAGSTRRGPFPGSAAALEEIFIICFYGV